MTPIHYIQIIDSRNEFSSLRKKCIASLKGKMRSEDSYELIQVEYSSDTRKMIRLIDTIKLDKAASIPDLCVLDTDCFVSKPLHELSLIEGIPYFGQYGFNDSSVIPDIFYFYVNNRCDYFYKYLNPNSIMNQGGYSVDLNALKRLSKFGYIQEDTFIHTYETMSQVVCQQKIDGVIKEHEMDKMELVMLRKSVEQMAMTMKTYENLKKAYHRG